MAGFFMADYEMGGLVRLCPLGKLQGKMFERRLPQVKHLFQVFFGHAIAHEDIHFQNEISVFVNQCCPVKLPRITD